ncbi:MAG TPA: polysaccharide pyruvyl transferase family protein [Chthoniobacter sp.]
MTSTDDPLLSAYLESPDPDATLREQMAAVIEERRRDSAVCVPRQPGEPLRLFLAGYAGAGNSGSDIRVTELIRQVDHLFQGTARFALSVLDTRLMEFTPPGVTASNLTFLPRYLPSQTAQCDIAVACEGSMFKSNFSDAISLVMLGTLGLGASEGKLAVGYGAEAGEMTPPMEKFAREYCRGALITCRNTSSRRRVENLGLRAAPGTDTAWTYEPAEDAMAQRLLREAGWDGSAPIVTVCPVNPFWWPVRPDAVKYAAWMKEKRHDDHHYGFFYFHNDSAETARQTRSYLAAVGGAVGAYVRETGAFPIIVGMDKVDRMACRELAASGGLNAPIFARPEVPAAHLVALLRQSAVLVSSRFHALVCAMPAGVPSIGISYDERIENLLAEGNGREWVLRVDDPLLEEQLLQRLRRLNAAEAADNACRVATENLRRLGEMTKLFADEVSRAYPDWERPELGANWEAYLPPLAPALRNLLNTYPPAA